MSLIRANRTAVATLWLAFAVAAPLARTARAEPAPNDAAMAETLFEDAKKRMATGDYAGACPKLAESYRLDPGGGTLTALALCHEQLGKTATAWAEFIEVVTDAQQAGRADREKFARQHVTALAPHLSQLTISVAPETAALAEVQVRRDGVVVGSAAWGVAAPVDPGDHRIEATAPGHKAWSARIKVHPDGDRQSVSIPALEEEVAPDTSAPVPPLGQSTAEPEKKSPESDSAPAASQGGSNQRAIAYVVGGTGIAAVLVGGLGFGVPALSKSSDAKSQCPSTTTCPASAVQENSDAKTDALITDVTVGLGLAAVGVGFYLLLSAPSGTATPASSPEGSQSRAHLRLQPTLTSRVAGLSVLGDW